MLHLITYHMNNYPTYVKLNFVGKNHSLPVWTILKNMQNHLDTALKQNSGDVILVT